MIGKSESNKGLVH